MSKYWKPGTLVMHGVHALPILAQPSREDGVMWQSDLFSVPRARREDPETSHEAAGSVRNLTAVQSAILMILRAAGPGTDEEIARAYRSLDRPPCSPSGLRSRRAELVRLGKVEDSGKRVKLETGRNAIVWRRREQAD